VATLYYMGEYLKAAPNPRIVAEDGKSYIINFVLGPDYWSSLGQTLKAQGVDLGTLLNPSVIGNQTIDMTVTINKANGLVSDWKDTCTVTGRKFGDSTSAIDYTNWVYNPTVNVELPAAAQGATEIPIFQML